MSETIPMPDIWTPAPKRKSSPLEKPDVKEKPLEAVLTPSNESEAQSPADIVPEAPEAAPQPVEPPVLGKTARDHEPVVKIVEINSVDLQKHLVRQLLVEDNPQYLGMSNEAKVLAVQLVTLWDNRTKTGVICPTADRLMAWNDWTEHQLRAATLELAMFRLFKVKSDARGGINVYVPLFLEEALALKKETGELIRGTTDHTIHQARYSRMSSTARVISLVACANTTAKFHDLGFIRGQPKSGYIIDGTRGVRAGFFHHPMFADKSKAGIELIATLDELWPDEVMSCVAHSEPLPVAMLTRIAGSPAELQEVKSEILDSGYWDFRMTANETSYVFTPQMRLHQSVWDLNMLHSGGMRTAFETWNGFYPMGEADHEGDDPYTCRPPLGYHWLYVLKFGTLRQVGESTQPLRRRAQQHAVQPTNAFAEKHITIELRQGHVPEVEFAGCVHNVDAAEAEMALLQRVREQGQDVSNAITEVSQNRGTIKQDRRFRDMPQWRVKELLIETQYEGHPSAKLAQRLNNSLNASTT